MDISYDPRIKEWHVIFGEANAPFWWQKYLKKGYRHVSALGFDVNSQKWIFFDPGWDGIVIRAVDTQAADLIINMALTDGKILRCIPCNEKVIKPRILMTCVSQMAHLLGINKFLLTPYGLHCALTKIGASDSFPKA